MKKSVLVDFYNLRLRSGWLKEPQKCVELSPNSKELLEKHPAQKEIIPPDEKERQRIIKFFEVHAPDVVRKLTVEERREVRDFFSQFSEYPDSKLVFMTAVVGRSNPPWESNSLQKREEIKSITKELLPYKKEYVDSITTLEGYEASHRISWFDSDAFGYFAEEHHRIKKLIDRYLKDRFIEINDLRWLEERKSTYSIERFALETMMGHDGSTHVVFDKEIFEPHHDRPGCQFVGIILGELFPSIYDYIMLVLNGKLEIQRCERNDCDNIILKSGRRKYCSDECSYKAKLENDREGVRQEAAKVYKTLCDLIDKWLKPDSEGITATKLKEELKKIAKESYKPGSIETSFLSGVTAKSLGRLLPQVEEKLKEKGILIEIKKRKKGYLYQFTQIKS